MSAKTAVSATADYVARLRRAPRAIRLFLGYTLLANIGLGVFQLIYNLYLVRIGFREDFIGTFSAVNTIAMAATALLIGPLIARLGAWRCLLAGTALLVVAALGQALIAAEPALLACAALGGVAQAGMAVPVMPFIIEHADDDGRADTAAVTFSLISLSMTAGALVGGRLPGALARLGAAFAPETVVSYRATLVAGVALAAVGLVPLLLIGRGRPAGQAQTGPLIGNAHRPRRVRRDMTAFIAVGALFSVSAAAIVPFYNVYLQDLGAGPGVIGNVFTIAGVCGAALGLVSPALARRYGVLRVAAGMRVAGVPLIALLLVAPSLPLAFAAQIVRSATLSMAWPVDSNFIAEILPNRQRATVFSLRSAAWNITWAGASFVVGRLIVATGGYGVAFATSCAFAALSVAVFSLSFLRHPHVVAQRAEAAGGRRRTAVKLVVDG